MTAGAERSGPTRFRVVGIEDGMMLRQLLAKRLKVAPTIAAELVRAGGVYVGPVRMCVPTVRVAEGERVTVYRAAMAATPVESDALRVVHRDEACVIVDKPHGVPAAATRATSRGTVAAALVAMLEQEKVARPYVGLVHALPTAAAGLAVFTIRGQATESFFKAFVELGMLRRYVVRVAGAVEGGTTCDAGLVLAPSGVWRAARAGDREVVATKTEWVPRATVGGEALCEVTLSGGGTAGGEAVRLHAAALGVAVAGDEEAMMLLAEHVAFTQPRTGVAVAVTAERPAWAVVGA